MGCQPRYGGSRNRPCGCILQPPSNTTGDGDASAPSLVPSYRTHPVVEAGPIGRRAGRTAPVGEIPLPRVDARTVPVSLSVTERACTTRGWAATSGSFGRRYARRLPRCPRCPRRRGWWGTAASRRPARGISSSSCTGSGAPRLPSGSGREARTRKGCGSALLWAEPHILDALHLEV